ncbi:MAG: hypothetical protein MZV70_22295 [Desulfobacterales bacterium]|nr:hypothetical protein [Desulfobacterales bacterium]
MEEGLTGNYYQWFTAKKLKGDVKEFFIQDPHPVDHQGERGHPEAGQGGPGRVLALHALRPGDQGQAEDPELRLPGALPEGHQPLDVRRVLTPVARYTPHTTTAPPASWRGVNPLPQDQEGRRHGNHGDQVDVDVHDPGSQDLEARDVEDRGQGGTEDPQEKDVQDHPQVKAPRPPVRTGRRARSPPCRRRSARTLISSRSYLVRSGRVRNP